MRTVSAMELRARMGEILNRASAGERITIERGRRPLAVLVSPEDAARLAEAPEERAARRLAALDRLDELWERMARVRAADHAVPEAAALIREERDRGHGDHG
jgi:prevent-host-death family protein